MFVSLGKISTSFESNEGSSDKTIGKGLTFDPIEAVGSFCVDLEIFLSMTYSAKCSSCFEVTEC